MRPGARVAGAVVALLAALLVAAASRAPWTASPERGALLRLSWRTPAEVAEECRPLSEEEKADLPVHMRAPEVCESRAVPYLLEVAIDGSAVLSETIRGAGARADRPIRVFHEVPLPAGSHDVAIVFAPVEVGDDEEENGEREEENGEREEDVEDPEPATIALEYSAAIHLEPREIALVTLDPARRALVRVTPR